MLKTNASYRAYFDPTHPLLQTEQALNADYQLQDSLVVAIESPDELLVSTKNIELVKNIVNSINSNPLVSSNINFLTLLDDSAEYSGDSFEGHEYTENEVLAEILTTKQGLGLISKNGKITLLVIEANLPSNNAVQNTQLFVNDIRSKINHILLNNGSNLKVRFTSTLALNEAYITLVRTDLKQFIPALLIIYLFSLLAFFRHFLLSLSLLCSAMLAAATTFGLSGWLGFELAAINAFTPVIIVSLSITLAVHLVTGYCRYLEAGEAAIVAMQKSRQFNLRAISLSVLTTVGGFLLLTLSPSPPIRLMGILVSIGVILSFIYGMTLLSFILPRLKLSQQQATQINKRINLQHLWSMIAPHQSRLLIPLLILVLTGSFLVAQLQINDNVYEYFPPDHQFSVGTRLIDQQFYGAAKIDYSIDSGKRNGIANLEYQLKLQEFSHWLESQAEITHISGLSQLFLATTITQKRLDYYLNHIKNFPLVSKNFGSIINHDLSASRITVHLKSMTTKELIQINHRIQAWLDKHLKPYHYLGGVSPDLIFSEVNQQNAFSMFVSLAIALIAIGFISGWLMKSLKVIGITLICNLLPLICVFSLWFIVGGYISMGSAVVMGMITGVIIDDTIHMLVKYRQLNDSESVSKLYVTVGPAIMVTSITLCSGIIVGLLSDFRPIVELSGLSAAIISLALVFDLICLPALLNRYVPKVSPSNSSRSDPISLTQIPDQ
ncbi:MAG: putative RND superfamily exporter protein [Pseudohongiellaceae bacterium]|jgi:predicted RND superfamily exporter protein